MFNTRNIKVWICMVCMATTMAAPAQGPVQLDIIDMAAISRMTPQQLEILAEGLAAEEIMRTKRSSAQSLTSAVVSKASSGLQSKVGLLGQASAAASSFIASASSKTGHTDHDQGYSYEPHSEKVDFLGLKKSILYTLFQAVKAITGGVTILKGQLIKGGGALAATLGKVISSKGDAVSNIGKKIVSSAALSPKKPIATPVYGPPPAHIEYAPPSAYGGTAPGHFAHTAPSAPSGFAPHKYPAHLDGRGKLSGVHAGLVILTPVGDAIPSESQHPSGYTPLEPQPSFLHSVFSAVRDVFSSAPPHTVESSPILDHSSTIIDHPPPPPPFKPMAWNAVDSYGEPVMADSYLDYDPRHPYSPYEYASSKLSSAPTVYKHEGLTSAKIQKINANLEKVNAYLNENQRSSEVLPRFNKEYADMLKKGEVPLFPTPVVSDNEIGVLPAELLPDPLTTTTTTTTMVPPKNSTVNENNRRKKEVKFILRGNRIVQV